MLILIFIVLLTFLSSTQLNSINKFLKKSFQKHFPATGEASLCGSIVECNLRTGLAININQFIFGGDLKDSQ